MRVRLGIRSRLGPGEGLETSALVNSGFEAERPQLLIPVKLARLLELWPTPKAELRSEVYETAGGLTRIYVVEDSLEVSITTLEHPAETVVCDAAISESEEEVLISDSLGQELGIMILALRDGMWRLAKDPQDLVRRSEKQRRWR